MNLFMKDVLEQAEHIEKAVNYYETPAFLNLLDEISKFEYSKVLFTGMGSSNYASLSAAMFLKEHGINSSVVSAGQLLHYELNSIDEKTLLVLVSQSGESPEIIGLINKFQGRANMLGITNKVESTLARSLKYCLHLNVKDEVTVSSRTYTTTIIMTHLAASCLVHETENCLQEVKASIKALKNFINSYKEKSHEIAAFLKDVSFISCMGRGPSFGSALAGGLFLKEASKFPSEGTDAAEFRHGPIEVVDNSFGAIVFAPTGKTSVLSTKIASDIAVKGGKVLLVTNQEILPENINNNIYIFKYDSINEYFAPIVEIAAIQFLCDALAKKSGIVPGEFRWASKITTEE